MAAASGLGAEKPGRFHADGEAEGLFEELRMPRGAPQLEFVVAFGFRADAEAARAFVHDQTPHDLPVRAMEDVGHPEAAGQHPHHWT